MFRNIDVIQKLKITEQEERLYKGAAEQRQNNFLEIYLDQFQTMIY